jgi:hypothetical protein
MPIELFAIGSSGLALVVVLLMVLTRLSPDGPPNRTGRKRDG